MPEVEGGRQARHVGDLAELVDRRIETGRVVDHHEADGKEN